MYVHSFVDLSVTFMDQGSNFCVKVYRTLYYKDLLMDFFLFDVMVDIGLKFYSVPYPVA